MKYCILNLFSMAQQQIGGKYVRYKWLLGYYAREKRF